jgi:hypothetical protein
MKFNVNSEIHGDILPGFWLSLIAFSLIFFMIGFLKYDLNIVLKAILVIAETLLILYNITLNNFTLIEILLNKTIRNELDKLG